MKKYYKTDYFLFQDAGTHIVQSELDYAGNTVINTETLYTNQEQYRRVRRGIRLYSDNCKEITEDEYHILRIS